MKGGVYRMLTKEEASKEGNLRVEQLSDTLANFKIC